MKEATRKVIIKIKELKEQKELSCQDILDICENNKDSVSPSTVRRICAKGSEDGPDFRPYSLNAVLRAVVGAKEIKLTADEKASLTDTEKDIITENSALRAAFDLNEAMIEDLRKQIETLEEEKAALSRTLHEMQIRLDTTNEIIRMAVESFRKG